MAFMSGTDNYLLTRLYAKWLDRETVAIKASDYKTIYEQKDIYINPWKAEVEVNGTDANQFHPYL